MHAKFQESGPEKKPKIFHLKICCILFAADCTCTLYITRQDRKVISLLLCGPIHISFLFLAEKHVYRDAYKAGKLFFYIVQHSRGLIFFNRKLKTKSRRNHKFIFVLFFHCDDRKKYNRRHSSLSMFRYIERFFPSFFLVHITYGFALRTGISFWFYVAWKKERKSPLPRDRKHGLFGTLTIVQVFSTTD